MTQTELYDSHCHIPDYGGCRELSVKASIEYAIAMLWEMANSSYQIITDDGVIAIPQGTIYRKIKELKSLIK
jgi:hypothetical protein